MSCPTEQEDYSTLEDVVLHLRPVEGQDLRIVYHAYDDLDLDADADVSAMTFRWGLWVEDATTLTLSKTTASGITLATPLITVTITAANMTALTAGQEYKHRLWRIDSGETYPVTGIGTLTPQAAEPTST